MNFILLQEENSQRPERGEKQVDQIFEWWMDDITKFKGWEKRFDQIKWKPITNRMGFSILQRHFPRKRSECVVVVVGGCVKWAGIQSADVMKIHAQDKWKGHTRCLSIGADDNDNDDDYEDEDDEREKLCADSFPSRVCVDRRVRRLWGAANGINTCGNSVELPNALSTYSLSLSLTRLFLNLSATFILCFSLCVSVCMYIQPALLPSPTGRVADRAESSASWIPLSPSPLFGVCPFALWNS